MPIRVPVNIVGNVLGILGEANAAGVGVNNVESGTPTEHGWRDIQSTGDNNGILNGTQVYLPISVPVNVVGNAAAVLGEANAAGAGVNKQSESAHTTEGWWPGGGAGPVHRRQQRDPERHPALRADRHPDQRLRQLARPARRRVLAGTLREQRGRRHGKGHWKKESGHVTEGGFAEHR